MSDVFVTHLATDVAVKSDTDVRVTHVAADTVLKGTGSERITSLALDVVVLAKGLVRTQGEAQTRSEWRLSMRGEMGHPDVNTYGCHVATRVEVSKGLLQGVGDDQMLVLFREDSDDAGAIGAGATHTIDMVSALDAYGDSLVLADVTMAIVKHKASSLASAIQLRAGSVSPWTNLLSATADITLRPGDMFILGTFDAGNLIVEDGNQSLDIVNADGSNAAEYEIEVWGR